jgi:hypothetical protein
MLTSPWVRSCTREVAGDFVTDGDPDHMAGT